MGVVIISDAVGDWVFGVSWYYYRYKVRLLSEK